MVETGLYIHIPFCAAKCVYCDFLSYPPQHQHGTIAMQALYKEALLAEISAVRDEMGAAMVVDSIYIGGGTPTIWPASFLSEILKEVQQFPLTDDVEITVEANPGTLTESILSALKDGGVNRLSLGLQAWQDEFLVTLGRIHSRAQFLQGFQALQALGITNINVDLMFGLPGQTMKDWSETLAQVTALEPSHISAYSLTPEEGTELWSKLEKKQWSLPDEETERSMYALGNKVLKEAGYRHYELSNYAKPGYESRHNNRYWIRKAYIGFGLGAHSFWNNTRWHNPTDVQQYLRVSNDALRREEEKMIITPAEAMSETMFLGLRKIEGVSEFLFEKTFGVALMSRYGEWIVKKCNEGLLYRADGRIALTDRGLDLANQVFVGFM